VSTGHSHPKVVKAIQEQAEKSFISRPIFIIQNGWSWGNIWTVLLRLMNQPFHL